MSAPLFSRSHTQVIGTEGRAAPGAKIYFFNPGTTTPRVVYNDSALAAPRTHPVVAGATGLIPGIYLPYGDFRVRVETSIGVVLSDDDYVANPAPPAVAEGGGGDPVAESQLIQTGDVIWSPRDGLRNGFVRMNRRTIGSAASGATERANPDTLPLYTFLWDNVDDAYCPVSGGRGASAAADFAANKPLSLPKGNGAALWGLDTMGNNAANIAQRSSTINTTNLSSTVTVADNGGLARGMYVISANIPAGTTISVIQGGTLSLTAAATATASGTPVRFSLFADPEKPGATGGSISQQLNQRELPTDIGQAVTTLTNGTLVFRGGLNNTQAGSGTQGPSVIDTITASTTISNPFGGTPHAVQSPGVVGTFYMKL